MLYKISRTLAHRGRYCPIRVMDCHVTDVPRKDGTLVVSRLTLVVLIK